MTIMENENATRGRAAIVFDNGVLRDYNCHPSLDWYEGSAVAFALPTGEVHHYDLVKEIEITPGTKKVKVLSASMSAFPGVETRG